MFDELAKTYFATKKGYEEGLALIRRYNDAQRRFRSFGDLEAHFFQQLTDSENELLESAIALLERRPAPSAGKAPGDGGLAPQDVKRLADAVAKRQDKARGAPVLQSLTLSKAFEAFLTEKRNEWKVDNGSEGQYTQEVFPLLVEVAGKIKTT